MKPFDFDFRNLSKEDWLKIAGVALVTLAMLAGLLTSGEFFRGTVDVTPDASEEQILNDEDEDVSEDDVSPIETCEANSNNLKGFFPILNTAINTFNDTLINLDSDNTNYDALETIAEGVFSIEITMNSDDWNDCSSLVQLTDDFELDIDILNDSISEINGKISSTSQLSNLASLNPDFTCDEGRQFNEETNSCITPEPTVCEYLDQYNLLSSANALLLEFQNRPESFGNSALNRLNELISNEEISDAISFTPDEFIYQEDATELSVLLNSLVTQIQSRNGICAELDSLDVLSIQVQNGRDLERVDDELISALNQEGSCPVNSEFDSLAGACYCPLTDTHISSNDTCELVDSDIEVPEGVLCADGTIAESEDRCPNGLNGDDDITNDVLEDLLEELDLSELPGVEEIDENGEMLSSNFIATVLSVIDGDDISVELNNERINVRLACIDAPEVSQTPWGENAANELRNILSEGDQVELRIIDKDSSGRTIAEVFINNRSVNLSLVENGAAVIYPDYINDCLDNKETYLAAEENARQDRLGFWSQDDPTMPWEFRDDPPVRTSEPSAPTIASNTHANVMQTEIVKGNTGPKILVVMIIGLLLNMLVLKFAKR